MEIHSYTHFQEMPSIKYDSFLKLGERIFGAKFVREVESLDPSRKHNLYLFMACEGDKVVGFKFGYELSRLKYYSWLGGVDPDHRGKGIASQLMNTQHEWCKTQGYKVVQTKTKNKFRNMLVLNIKNGFDIKGTFTDEEGEPKIILEKEI